MTTFENRILHYVEAGFPILYLNTFEEGKAQEAILSTFASNVGRSKILEWDGTDRICDACTGEIIYDSSPLGSSPLGSSPLAGVLNDRLSAQESVVGHQVFLLKNIDTFMDDPAVIARMKKWAERINSGLIHATIFILSPILRIPKEIEKYITVIEMEYLTDGEIRDVIREFAEENETPFPERLIKEYANAFKGLSEFEIQNIMQLILSESTEITKSQISLVFEQKQQMIKKAGILEMIAQKESMDDIGGLENLKEWLQQKEKVLSDMEGAKAFGVDMPKGVLIAGIPGCGKSITAKAAAKLFNIPLLRLDMGRLLGKYVGESEANMRKAIELAEAISPCVLWVDELEKAFAGIGGKGSGAEVTTRLFGSFLTWLQEKETPVFVVATANDIMNLPPELLRKGRFDEIFYVGLPDRKEQQKIFEIHIKKRRPNDLSRIQIDQLLDCAKGCSGADIEGIVRESVERAFAGGKQELTTDDLLESIKNTHPLSEIMKDTIEKMQKEYETRKFKNASR